MSPLRTCFLLAVAGVIAATTLPVHAQSQPELNATAAAAADAADNKLTATYQKLRAQLKDDAQVQELLDEAEKAWLTYRDQEAEFEASPDIGGSIHPLTVSTIATRLTEERIKYLQVMIDNGGPDAP